MAHLYLLGILVLKGIIINKENKILNIIKEENKKAAHLDMETRNSKVAMDIFKRPAFGDRRIYFEKKGNDGK